jgi:hypothetical protein
VLGAWLYILHAHANCCRFHYVSTASSKTALSLMPLLKRTPCRRWQIAISHYLDIVNSA